MDDGVGERDYQRSKVYEAERDALAPSEERGRFQDLRSAQAYADRVTSSSCWRRLRLAAGLLWRRLDYVVVLRGRGSRPQARAGWWQEKNRNPRRSGTPYGEVHLPRRSWTPWVLLHELSHFLVPTGVAQHGWQFAGAYLVLVRRFMGTEAGAALRKAYRSKGVCYFRPRRRPAPATPEERAELMKRLEAARLVLRTRQAELGRAIDAAKAAKEERDEERRARHRREGTA